MTKTRDRAGRIRQRLSRIPAEVAEEVRRMVGVREMVHGYVYHSRRRCGKPSCRCARGEPHEAWVLAAKVNGRQTTRSLSGARRQSVQRLAENYRRYRQAQRAVRKLCGELTQLGRELERLIGEDPFKEECRR